MRNRIPNRSVLLLWLCMIALSACQTKPPCQYQQPILAPEALKYHEEEWQLKPLSSYGTKKATTSD